MNSENDAASGGPVRDFSRENQYLRDRVAELQSDVIDLSAENSRLRQELERRSASRPRVI